MADQDRAFTKEDLKMLLNLGGRLISNQANRIGAEIKQKIQNKFNLNVRFANMLKAKYDALIAAGFSEKQAFDLAIKAVEETLKQATGQVDNIDNKMIIYLCMESLNIWNDTIGNNPFKDEKIKLIFGIKS